METQVKILIVDDDEISREILHEAIDQQGVEITLCADGVGALATLSREPFDILITDLNMPQMDGLALLREARQHFPHLLTIIITGYGSLESAIEAIRQGTYDYVQKPFKMEEMAVTTRNAVQIVRMMKERSRILEQLLSAHEKLSKLEAERTMGGDPSPMQLEELASLAVSYPSSRHLPLSSLEKPTNGTADLLIDLERLKNLKLNAIINDKEFDELKKAILDRVK